MNIRIYKFGGAALQHAAGVRNVASILKNHRDEDLVVIVSAMGKMTNALEQVHQAFVAQKDTEIWHSLDAVYQYHQEIMKDLFPDKNHAVYVDVEEFFDELKTFLAGKPGEDPDFDYDQIVSFGELISSTIVYYFFLDDGFPCQWFDARKLIRTDHTWREGRVNWVQTNHLIMERVKDFRSRNLQHKKLFLTQGFIGGTDDGHTTTLGREGSDFSAAIFAYATNASEVTIWKDVPGLLNADPRLFDDARKLDEISYAEAIELAYYGAQVIHPRTIQPLQNKGIPLYIRSFLLPNGTGSLIHDIDTYEADLPSFIFRFNQALLSISPRDFSFITEKSLHLLFGLMADYRIRLNLMQHSAITVSICVDEDERKLPDFILSLKQKDFQVRYNKGLELITIRHYSPGAIENVLHNRTILLEQRSRSTVQYIVNRI